MSRKAIRRLARQRVKENWICAFVPLLLYGVLLSFLPGVSLFLAGPLTLGLSAVFLRFVDGEKPSVQVLFSGFSRFGPAFLLSVVKSLFIMLWSLLFYIPGVMKAYSYAMAYYVMAESPNIKATEALKESQRRMAGHRMELFLLQLSFVGWWLLSAVTCGLAALYAAPYYSAAIAIFYRDISHGNTQGPELALQEKKAELVGAAACSAQTTVIGGAVGSTQVLTPSQQIGNGVFQGVSGSLEGQCFSFPDGDVFAVGRDSQQCGILVESSNISVSRCHCTVQYIGAENAYFVTDLSVNGSYVGEVRLPKGEAVRLAPGTTVSLGDGREAFCLN